LTESSGTSHPGSVLLWSTVEPAEDERLCNTLTQFGHQVLRLGERAALRTRLEQAAPEALLVDLEAEGSAADARRGLLDYLAELRADPAQRASRLYVLSSEDSLPLRLQAARVGASGF